MPGVAARTVWAGVPAETDQRVVARVVDLLAWWHIPDEQEEGRHVRSK
jgi:hypothetical protein